MSDVLQRVTHLKRQTDCEALPLLAKRTLLESQESNPLWQLMLVSGSEKCWLRNAAPR
jgi:hypothetical protein